MQHFYQWIDHMDSHDVSALSKSIWIGLCDFTVVGPPIPCSCCLRRTTGPPVRHPRRWDLTATSSSSPFRLVLMPLSYGNKVPQEQAQAIPIKVGAPPPQEKGHFPFSSVRSSMIPPPRLSSSVGRYSMARVVSKKLRGNNSARTLVCLGVFADLLFVVQCCLEYTKWLFRWTLFVTGNMVFKIHFFGSWG